MAHPLVSGRGEILRTTHTVLPSFVSTLVVDGFAMSLVSGSITLLNCCFVNNCPRADWAGRGGCGGAFGGFTVNGTVSGNDKKFSRQAEPPAILEFSPRKNAFEFEVVPLFDYLLSDPMAPRGIFVLQVAVDPLAGFTATVVVDRSVLDDQMKDER
jgi:hypothetical protein